MGTSFCTTVATSTSAGGGGAAALGFRQPVNSNEAAGSRATRGQTPPKRERDFLLPRVRIVICIAEIPCLDLASLSLQADSQLKGMAHMMLQILPEVHPKPAQLSRRLIRASMPMFGTRWAMILSRFLDAHHTLKEVDRLAIYRKRGLSAHKLFSTSAKACSRQSRTGNGSR